MSWPGTTRPAEPASEIMRACAAMLAGWSASLNVALGSRAERLR